MKVGLAGTRAEVDVEKLERMVSVIFGEVTAKLDVTLTARGKGNIRGSVEIEDGGRVDDEGASGTHREVVERNGTTRERSEGQPLRAGEIGFLKADDVALRNKIVVTS